MASRLNTILVVVSLPLVSAITLYWTRTRRSVTAATTGTTTASITNTPESESAAAAPSVTENSPQPQQQSHHLTHHPQSHQVHSCDNCIAAEEEVTSPSSSAPASAITEQPASDPALVDPDSVSEGRDRITGSSAGTSDSTELIIMQIADTADLSQQPAAANPTTDVKSQPVTANGSPAAVNGHQQRQTNGGAAVTDLTPTKDKDKDPALKSKNRKEAESMNKKNASAKKEKTHSDSKDRKVVTGTSPNSETRSEDLPAGRSRKTHDSGGSVGGLSVDSGTDVMSPASSAADSKSSDRSVDSPGAAFKSDASQGSPCHWGTSDSHSEGSSDSGKGSETQSSSYSPMHQFNPTINQRTTANVVYQFEIPADLVGKLIGKLGTTIKHIQTQSRARIVVNDYPVDNCEHLKICTVDGDRVAIADALRLIRHCFPVNAFPQLTLSQINAGPIATAPLYLQENYPNDVIMSSLVSAGHLFLQQPTHPSYEALVVLNHLMNVTYTEHDAPAISSPSVGIIVAATVPSLPGWYRALIVAVSDDQAFCDVKYVDYGGCSRLETSGLRQIRMDFMNLPFQACECYLADILPIEGDTWSSAATECFEKLAHGCLLKAIVTGFSDDGCSLVKLYKPHGMTNMCLNEELVNRGLARWIPPPAATSASE